MSIFRLGVASVLAAEQIIAAAAARSAFLLMRLAADRVTKALAVDREAWTAVQSTKTVEKIAAHLPSRGLELTLVGRILKQRLHHFVLLL